MAHLPAGIAAIIAITRAAGPVIVYADSLSAKQCSIAKLMALSACVRNHKCFIAIKLKDLREVLRFAA